MSKIYSAWVGGIEVNDNYLTKSEAQSVAAAYVADGYEDVAIRVESVFTCEHCWNGLATENFGKWQVCPDCLEFLKACKEENRQVIDCDCKQEDCKMIVCLDCKDILERDC